ncbi:MAG TPA: MFS transporter [Bryobacteraceae bacterium]|nr:MFS transporter [Bryobacteraceae bacterium]
MKPRARVRYSVVLLALLINMLCYTDRVCIAVAGPEMRKEFDLSQAQMGLVYSIFSLSYFLGQTPWGIAADRFGARGIVSLAVAGWSAFTALTATAWSFASLMAIRFTFGALEAALSPSIASAFGRWIPITERSTAFGAFLGGGRLGGAITPPIAGFLLLRFGWRMPFVMFGAIGLLGSLAWFYWFRNRPEEHPAVSQAELERIRSERPEQSTPSAGAPWAELLSSTRLWCLLATAFGSTFLWQFYITWFPTYLRERRGMSLSESAFYASLPFLLGVGSTWVGGILTDWIGRRSGDRPARTIVGLVSLASAAILMSAGVWCAEAGMAALLMGCAAGAVDLYLGAAWSSAVDIGGSSGGAVAGMMNAASNCAGFASPALMGWVLQRSGDWDSVLLLGAGTTAVSAVLWLFVNPRRRPLLSPLASAAKPIPEPR